MSDEKPMHVRVAEALGWTEVEINPNPLRLSEWSGIRPGDDYFREIPDFSTDWSATGPLIEKYHISLEWHLKWPDRRYRGRDACWYAHSSDCVGFGSMPLIAVCNLVLDLKQRGKL